MDIDSYSKRYSAQYRDGSSEPVLIKMRRRRVLASLRRHRHRQILEIGCGLEPVFLHVEDFHAYTVVEPAREFASHARTLASNRPGVQVVEGYLEEVVDSLAGVG